jgi:hypothetical protein
MLLPRLQQLLPAVFGPYKPTGTPGLYQLQLNR